MSSVGGSSGAGEGIKKMIGEAEKGSQMFEQAGDVGSQGKDQAASILEQGTSPMGLQTS